MRVRGLKRKNYCRKVPALLSHPMRVRGLKLGNRPPRAKMHRRTPCGCVD